MLTATASPLMDRVPTEIRLMIFHLVLSHQGYSLIHKLPHRRHASRRDFKCPTLFTVSKRVLQEARDAFFAANTIKIRYDKERSWIVAHASLLCNVELTDEAAWLTLTGDTLWGSPQFFKACPRMTAIEIDCNEFSDDEQTVRRLIEGSKDFTDLRCLGMGLFEVQSVRPWKGSQPRIVLKQGLLLTHLQEARSILATMSSAEIYEERQLSRMAGPKAAPTYRRRQTALAFALWLKLYGLFATYCTQPNALRPSPTEVQIMAENMLFRPFVSDTVPWRRRWAGHAEVKIQDPDVDTHGADAVEWASELLALNLARIQYVA